MTLGLLGSGGLDELPLCDLNVQTKIKLLVYLLHLLMKVLVCLPAGEGLDFALSGDHCRRRGMNNWTVSKTWEEKGYRLSP